MVSNIVMTTKFCPKCKLDLPVDSFGPNKRRRDGLQGACKECMKQYRKDHYHNNKDPYLERAKNQKAAMRNLVAEIKEASPCGDCGVSYPFYVMQFDHLGIEAKLLNVAALTHRGSLAKILAEIKKCELVCANCHAVRTYNRSIGV